MKRAIAFTHEFVDTVPEQLRDGVLYISIGFATAIHLCACGCRNEVVTPLSPTDWILNFDGETVSLSPSIGNWGLPCRSHYWIRRDKIRWSWPWTEKQIRAARAQDIRMKKARLRAEPGRANTPTRRRDDDDSEQ